VTDAVHVWALAVMLQCLLFSDEQLHQGNNDGNHEAETDTRMPSRRPLALLPLPEGRMWISNAPDMRQERKLFGNADLTGFIFVQSHDGKSHSKKLVVSSHMIKIQYKRKEGRGKEGKSKRNVYSMHKSKVPARLYYPE